MWGSVGMPEQSLKLQRCALQATAFRWPSEGSAGAVSGGEPHSGAWGGSPIPLQAYGYTPELLYFYGGGAATGSRLWTACPGLGAVKEQLDVTPFNLSTVASSFSFLVPRPSFCQTAKLAQLPPSSLASWCCLSPYPPAWRLRGETLLSRRSDPPDSPAHKHPSSSRNVRRLLCGASGQPALARR